MGVQGRVSIVTGAGSRCGIGRAIALALAGGGAAVVVNDITPEGAETVAREIRDAGGKAIAFAADVSQRDQVLAMVDHTVRQFGRLDILVNNAGVSQPVKILDMTEDDWDRLLDINLKGTFLCTHAALPHMLKQGHGRIVCISSVAAKKGGGRIGGVHYAASKAGMIGFAKALVREVSPYGVTVNVICPGTIDTGKDAGRKQWDGTPADVGLELAKKSIPVGRLGTPADVAYAALFLASDEASFITGEVIDVNGGAYID